MNTWKSFFSLVLVLVIFPFPRSAPRQLETVYFDAGDPALLVLGNAYYEIGFRKSNGAIAYITDKATGLPVSEGSRNQCLWRAYTDGLGSIGGCSYNNAAVGTFSYTWEPATHTLVLAYAPAASNLKPVTAQVTVTAYADRHFDARLHLQSDWGAALDYVAFPADLVFVEAHIQEALLPYLPGILFNPAFFEQAWKTTVERYPGYWFADYIHLATDHGQLALYSLKEQSIAELSLGLVHDDAYLADSTYYAHNYGARVLHAGEWTSPVVRFWIAASKPETIDRYRLDNGIGQFRSLRQKVGARYARLSAAPLYKADATQLKIPFSAYPALLARVPVPALLHPVAYPPRGFDENYPDFLPPAAAWGTTAEMAAMFQQVQAQGFLVMPYTNPTWWDDESPTLQNLPIPLTITDTAAARTPGVPAYQFYGTHGGYIISPHVPFVRQRLAQLLQAVTSDLPSDLVFEDQIGARPWLFDYNPSAPSPTEYADGWLQHTRPFSDTLIRMTEKGADYLIETESGFHGSVLLKERLGEAQSWGVNTWTPYPLAGMLARDKAFFYQHDLASQTFTFDKATLGWNLALGYLLSYNLVASSFGGGLDSPWLPVTADFQTQVVAQYADERVTAFTRLPNAVTQTAFEQVTVTRNWHASGAYAVGEHELPPLGVLVQKNDGTLTAGVFTRYNGMALTPGDHYLIETRRAHAIEVRQPLGADTPLSIHALPAWQAGTLLQVRGYSRQDVPLGGVPVTLADGAATFPYAAQLAGEPVAYYIISRQPPTVTINQAAGQPDPTNTGPLRFTVVFSLPVSGFSSSDVSLSGTAGAAAASVSETAPHDGTTYAVLVSGMAGSGAVTAAIPAGAAQDAAGNANAASISADNQVTYDVLPPTVTIALADGQLARTASGPVRFKVVFSEAVSGFDAADIRLSGAAGAHTVAVAHIGPMDGTTYEVTAGGMAGFGAILLDLVDGAAVDAAGNTSLPATVLNNLVDYYAAIRFVFLPMVVMR